MVKAWVHMERMMSMSPDRYLAIIGSDEAKREWWVDRWIDMYIYVDRHTGIDRCIR